MSKVTVVALSEVRGLLAPAKNGLEHVLAAGAELVLEIDDEVKRLVSQGVLAIKTAVAKVEKAVETQVEKVENDIDGAE